jgi:hypothetical protein
MPFGEFAEAEPLIQLTDSALRIPAFAKFQDQFSAKADELLALFKVVLLRPIIVSVRSCIFADFSLRPLDPDQRQFRVKSPLWQGV